MRAFKDYYINKIIDYLNAKNQPKAGRQNCTKLTKKRKSKETKGRTDCSSSVKTTS